MDAKELILEIFRETDFVAESHLAGSTIDETSTEQIQLSIAAINKACSAYLNGQDIEPHTERFLRRSMEEDVYEEMELWGKFSPPPQFIQDDDKK